MRRTRSPILLLPLLLSLLLAGCAAGTARSGTRPASTDVITHEDLQDAVYNNVYELIESRRPNWLRIRGRQSISQLGGVIAYLDNARIGSAEGLRNVTLQGVHEVRFFDGRRATQRWGMDHQDGVIQVLTQPAER